jgi:hypothetical protein
LIQPDNAIYEGHYEYQNSLSWRGNPEQEQRREFTLFMRRIARSDRRLNALKLSW